MHYSVHTVGMEWDLVRKSSFAVVAMLSLGMPFVVTLPASAKEPNCLGREYPAKAITVSARSAKLEVDLGFGMTYRGIVELDGTVEPDDPVEKWYRKASDALRSKIGGKPIVLCVVDAESRSATFYVDGANINRWMIKEGFLPPLTFKSITTKF